MAFTKFSFSTPNPMALLTLFIAFVAPLIPPTTPSPMHPCYHDQSFDAKNGFQSTLIHVDRDKRLTKTELLRRTVKRGEKRVQWLESKITASPTVETDVHYASGEYLMTFSIGTPTPSPITAVMDTGSDLIWTQCKPCQPCINLSTPTFNPQKSLTYSKLACSTNLCKALSTHELICNNSYCNYYYEYEDDSFTRGVLATDTFTFGEKVTISRIGFGCGLANSFDVDNSSGVVGMGRGGLSLVSQMNLPRFSYWLPKFGSVGTGVLTMGCRANNPPGVKVKVKATPLIINPSRASYYYLSLQGITIGCTRLPIDNSTFAIRKDGSGGLIIDSGTTFTYLEESAFDQVKNELVRQIGLNTTDGGNYFGLDLCFNMTSKDPKMVKFPVFVFHFENGVDLGLMHSNYFFSVGGVGCLVMGATKRLSILGNFQQQNTLVIYDLAKGRLSFLPNYKEV